MSLQPIRTCVYIAVLCTPLSAFAASSNLALTLSAGDQQITLTWKPPFGTTQGVCWSDKPIIDAVNCFAKGSARTTWLSNQTSPVTIKKLTNGKKYYFSVVAENLNTSLVIISKVLNATPQKRFALNDTGITTCSNASQNNLLCPATDFPGQDAQSGRDVSQNDNRNGHAGFNFSKVSRTGVVLTDSALHWSCVKDNVTGLMWEVKTDDSGLHDKDWTYTWYQPDASQNGGFAGYPDGGSCRGSRCNTYAYVQAVNAKGWCGYKDWRLPTVDELFGIASLDRYSPSIDTAYFPETQGDWYWYWSSSPLVNNSTNAWIVGFGEGSGNWTYKDNGGGYVRLVRRGQ